jgi:hypothetical protein
MLRKKLVVIESDAVGNPWTMMVHLEDAPVALRAMMASIRFCFIAPLANPDTTELLFLY